MNDQSKWERVSDLLDNSGMTDLYDSLDHPGSPWWDLDALRPRLPLKYYHALLMLIGGRKVQLDDLPEQVAEIVEDLEDLGFASLSDEGADLNGLSLYRYRGCWLLADHAESSPTLYYGDDSVELASRISPVPDGEALDLCTGPGIIALVEATSGMHVTSVDVNPMALSLQRANTRLNGIPGKVDTIKSDLFKDLPNQQFDLITVNPPLLPIPDGVPYPFVGDGGPHGLDVTLAVLGKAARYLSATGTLLAVGMTTMRGLEIDQEPLLQSTLARNGLTATMTVLQCAGVRHNSNWNRSIAMTSMAFAPDAYDSPESAVDMVEQGYRGMSVDGVCTFVLRVRIGDGGLTVLQYGQPYSESMAWRL
ncbi:methyltransferase [uncultured Bifidobacterium sp.]|uniref:methyltransferase n=1 Tax=uncultured Bifidobacterium sp. TaxID=165187 RepID=UPI0025E3E34A|nr:methyltransferase [uncultured Bifidobacterium sp.]